MTEFLYNDSELQMDTCLILCIEELDLDNSVSPIDTRLFIGWNNELSDFLIREFLILSASSNIWIKKFQ